MPLDVYNEEYWMRCHHFPNYKISSLGRIQDTEFDEMVTLANVRSEPRANLKYGPDEFKGFVWQMMYATFWRAGWGIDVTISYRDGDSKNTSIFNLLFSKDGKPLLYQLNSVSGFWEKRRGSSAGRVRVVETGEIFDSVADVARAVGGYPNAIYMCLRGAQMTAKGLHYEWFE